MWKSETVGDSLCLTTRGTNLGIQELLMSGDVPGKCVYKKFVSSFIRGRDAFTRPHTLINPVRNCSFVYLIYMYTHRAVEVWLVPTFTLGVWPHLDSRWLSVDFGIFINRCVSCSEFNGQGKIENRTLKGFSESYKSPGDDVWFLMKSESSYHQTIYLVDRYVIYSTGFLRVKQSELIHDLRLHNTLFA